MLNESGLQQIELVIQSHFLGKLGVQSTETMSYEGS